MKRPLVPRPPLDINHLSVEAERNPLLQYLAGLRSERSRATMLSVLKRAARELARIDGLDEGLRADVTAESYQWGAPGAITFGRINLAVAAIAEAEHPATGEKQRATARLALAALRGVARAAFNLGLLSIDERQRIDDVRAPKLSGKKRGRALTDDERSALYAACADDETPRGRRDAALISTGLGAGLRRFEISALDLRDFSLDGELACFHVREGKGGRAEDVLAPADTAAAVLDWIAVRGQMAGALFWASAGRGRPLAPESRLSPAGIRKMLIARAEQAGIARTAPHDLRRSMITDILERTGDLALAQRRARHASPATTAGYDKRGDEALKRAIASTETGYKR